MAKTFPWREIMRFGFGVMGLAPSQFWRMTLRELSVLFPKVNDVMTRETLETLMQHAPDGDDDARQ